MVVKESAKELESLERKYHMLKREKVAMKNRLERKTMCKYWTMSNKQACPQDMIYALKKENPRLHKSMYEENLVKMAALAKCYHNNLQYKQ